MNIRTELKTHFTLTMANRLWVWRKAVTFLHTIKSGKKVPNNDNYIRGIDYVVLCSLFSKSHNLFIFYIIVFCILLLFADLINTFNLKVINFIQIKIALPAEVTKFWPLKDSNTRINMLIKIAFISQFCFVRKLGIP